MAGNFKRGGARGGAPKKSFNKKRSSPEEDDSGFRSAKKAKSNDETEATTLIPKLETDEDNNAFVALKANGTRRVTISDFKGKTLVSLREYYEDAGGDMKPGKKGIALTIEQYNALIAAAPLLESALLKREEDVVRPDYTAELVTKPAGGDEEEALEGEAEDEDEDNE